MRILRKSFLKAAVAVVVLVWAGPGGAADVLAATTSTGTVERPTLLVTADELGSVRDALTTDTYRREVYEESIKAVAEDWVGRAISIPPRSGYYHDFACTDGTRLVWPEELRHGEAITSGTRYRCPACESTYASEKLDGAVRYLQHVSLMVAARDLALVGSIENDDRYLRKGAEILNKYADAYPGRHTAATRGGILYQSLDEAVHFIFLAQAYDLLVAAKQLTPEQQKTIETKLLLECAEGLIACGTGGNWGSWHLSCVGVIGFATGNQRLIGYGITHFKKQMAEQLGDDGLWPESVHTYHFYPMRGFLQLAEAAGAHGIDLYNWEAKPGKGLKAMFTLPIRYAYPNLQLPAINDGWFWSFLPLEVYELGYHRLGLAELGWVVRTARETETVDKSDSPDGQSVWTVLHGIPVPADVKVPDLQSSNFGTIGIATLRMGEAGSNETMVTFDYGKYLGHGQPDKMGITLYAEGQLLMADYGTPSYGSSILPYYKGTASHNTIMIDGKNQLASRQHGLRAFVDDVKLKAAVAETTEVAHGVTWRGGVFMTPEYVLVTDDLKSTESHRYDSLLHSVGEGIVLDRGTSETVAAAELGLAAFDDARRLSGDWEAASLGWVKGGKVVVRAVTARSGKSEGFTASIPADSATRRVPALVQRITGNEAVFATALVTGANPLVRVSIEGEDVKVTGESFADTLHTDADGLMWTRRFNSGEPGYRVDIPFAAME